jgi:hypothetical protein
LLIPVLSFSQNTENSDSLASIDDENFSSIMLNLSYTQNDLEYLSGATKKIPTLFSSATFFHKTGFYFGGGYSAYFNDSIESYEYDMETGYQKYFDNGFDIDLSYRWHQFSGDSLLEGLSYDHLVSLMTGWEVDNFYFSSNLSYTKGNTQNYFFDIGIARFIQFSQLFFDTDVLLLNPNISASFSTDNWLYEGMPPEEKTETITYLKSYNYSTETFGYESFDFFLPVSYGIKNTYLTVSWLYRIPGQKYKLLGWENQSGFMFSLTYFFNFKK